VPQFTRRGFAQADDDGGALLAMRAATIYYRSHEPVLHPLVEPGQYASLAFTGHLLKASVNASIGTVGDVLDNALMESQIGL
jgi:transposase InsO family protein